MPHLVLLGTGGTIASRRMPSGGSKATDSAAELAAAAGDLDGDITVEVHDVLAVNSFNLELRDLRTISDAVGHALSRDDVDGVVVSHGTDTLEETAALLDLVHDDPRPVVLTGAQRSADAPDTDGPRNMRDALVVAASPDSRRRGALVVFAGEVFSAFGLRKAHTLAAQPFANVFGGPIGRVLDRPEYAFRPDARAPLARPGAAFDAVRVDLVLAYPGADSALLDAALRAGAQGVIVLGGGAGNPGTRLTEGIARASRAGVVVGLGTRTGAGAVVPLYAGGGAVDAVHAGAVPLGAVPATQARILLALILAEAQDAADDGAAETARSRFARICTHADARSAPSAAL
jgi:L-asparaginase